MDVVILYKNALHATTNPVVEETTTEEGETITVEELDDDVNNEFITTEDDITGMDVEYT